ncbi:MAG: hypothetical protein WBY53_19775 [Acidobacteriaceae bacterium]
MNRNAILITLTLLLAAAPTLSAQTTIPATTQNPPLPAALSTAKKLFLGNAGDQENADCLRAYDDLYTGLSSLNRFQLVTDPNQADLILELHYEIDLGQALVSSNNRSVRQFRVVLIDPHSHAILWTLVERTNYAILQSNRDKNLDETVSALTNDLSLLVSPAPIPPSNKSEIKHF